MPEPLCDPTRLAALRRTALLDSPPVEAFERLTRLATTILRAPVALVSLVDADRQFFVSCVGLPEPWASARQTPLSHSFCQHTLASEPLIIADARVHPLVHDNPAIADLGVVAYAGIPLVTSDGQTLGSFCVIDHQPRLWTEQEIAILTDLAAGVMTEIDLRAAIVERDRAQAATERERARLREIFQQDPALIALTVGPRHMFELANPTCLRVLGRAATDLIGRTVREAFPDPEARGFFALLDQVYTTGQPSVGTEIPVRLDRRGDGTLEDAYFSFVYQPLRGAGGPVEGILVRAFEVTEQVWARQRSEALARQLAGERDRLQQVLDVLPEGVQIVDATGQVLVHNAAAQEILGRDLTNSQLPLADPQAFAPYGLRHLDGTPYATQDLPLQRSVLQGEIVRGEQLLVRNMQDGHDIPLLVNSVPLRDATGAISGAVIVFQDITTIKNFERARDELLATVSHDLKNPLTAIQGLAELSQQQAARGGTPSSERMATRQAGIVTAATQMTALLNELLDVMQLQMGQPLALNRCPADLVALVRRVIAYQQQIATHPIHVDAAVPELVCLVDVDRMERVIGNLVSNAVKYSAEGEDVTVRLTREPEGTEVWAVLEVQDRGMGIPTDDLPHVFDHFYRAENAGETRGTGIGLASVREIVEQHGGTIALASQEGVGTTVAARLPLAEPLHS